MAVRPRLTASYRLLWDLAMVGLKAVKAQPQMRFAGVWRGRINNEVPGPHH